MDLDFGMSNQTGLFIENNEILENVLMDNGFEVLVELMMGEKTEDELINNTGVEPLKLKVMLNRLERIKAISNLENKVENGKINKVYTLANKDIFFNKKKSSSFEKLHMSAQILKMSKGILEYTLSDYPSMTQASFIKVSPDKISEFKNDIDQLYKKYNSLEDENESISFGYITILGPHKGL